MKKEWIAAVAKLKSFGKKHNKPISLRADQWCYGVKDVSLIYAAYISGYWTGNFPTAMEAVDALIKKCEEDKHE